MNWTDEKNERRCDLIDKDLAGTINTEESIELTTLTQELRVHIREYAPLPIEEARKLYQQLLEKAKRD